MMGGDVDRDERDGQGLGVHAASAGGYGHALTKFRKPFQPRPVTQCPLWVTDAYRRTYRCPGRSISFDGQTFVRAINFAERSVDATMAPREVTVIELGGRACPGYPEAGHKPAWRSGRNGAKPHFWLHSAVQPPLGRSRRACDDAVQIQILQLLRRLQRELQMAVLFVTHDVGVAVEISDRIAVMYAGRFVETGPVRAIIREPQHPYTKGLLASTVHGGMRGRRLEAIPGAPPNLAALPPGCAFAARCRYVQPACTIAVPREVWLGHEHMVRCIRVTPS
jgi:oligopeptide/dipeptide ABC transporter ATP-binding protein